MSKHTFQIKKTLYIPVSCGLAHILNEYERVGSIQQTIRFSICKISYIGCTPPIGQIT